MLSSVYLIGAVKKMNYQLKLEEKEMKLDKFSVLIIKENSWFNIVWEFLN